MFALVNLCPIHRKNNIELQMRNLHLRLASDAFKNKINKLQSVIYISRKIKSRFLKKI